MTRLTPVLDNNTRDAFVIGQAENPEHAADVFMAYMKDRMGPEDYAALERPAFAYRFVDGLSHNLRDDCPAGAFEPLR